MRAQLRAIGAISSMMQGADSEVERIAGARQVLVPSAVVTLILPSRIKAAAVKSLVWSALAYIGMWM